MDKITITDEAGKVHVLPGIPLPKTRRDQAAVEAKARAWAERRGIRVATIEHV